VKSETASTPAAVASPGRRQEARPKLQIIKTSSHAINAVNIFQRFCGGAVRGKRSGITIALWAVVASVTVVVAVFEPSSVTDTGETAQLAPAGAFVQFQVTVRSNP